jgi:hypothetical protein
MRRGVKEIEQDIRSLTDEEKIELIASGLGLRNTGIANWSKERSRVCRARWCFAACARSSADEF